MFCLKAPKTQSFMFNHYPFIIDQVADLDRRQWLIDNSENVVLAPLHVPHGPNDMTDETEVFYNDENHVIGVLHPSVTDPDRIYRNLFQVYPDEYKYSRTLYLYQATRYGKNIFEYPVGWWLHDKEIIRVDAQSS